MAGIRKVFLLLDIGTSEVRAAVARLTPDNSYEILTYEQVPSLGVSKGFIKDRDYLFEVISSLVDKIKERVGILPAFVCTGFSPAGIKVINASSKICLERKQKIDSMVIEKLEEQAKERCVPEKFTVMHVLPLQYKVDGYLCSYLEGYTGRVIESVYQLIIVPQKYIQELEKIMMNIDIEEYSLVFTPIAQAYCLIDKSSLELGCVLVDLGAETTKISSFKHGKLSDAVVLPLGIQHIISDLAVGMHTTVSSATDLFYKVLQIDTASSFGSKDQYFEQEKVFSIVEARLKEICELTTKTINSMEINYIPGGIKLIGKGARLPGIRDFLTGYLGDHHRISYINEDDYRSDTLKGLANYCLQYFLLNLKVPSTRKELIFNKLQKFFPNKKFL